jgi:hypothetical protein
MSSRMGGSESSHKKYFDDINLRRRCGRATSTKLQILDTVAHDTHNIQ